MCDGEGHCVDCNEVPDMACCDGSCYNTTTQKCCWDFGHENAAVCDDDKTCCEDDCYDPETQECCGGNVITKCDPADCETCDGEAGACVITCVTSPDTECCDGECYDPAIKECCGDNVIFKCDPDKCKTCDGDGNCEVCNGEPGQCCVDGECEEGCGDGPCCVGCESCVEGDCEDDSSNCSGCFDCFNTVCTGADPSKCSDCEVCMGDGTCDENCPYGEICCDDESCKPECDLEDGTVCTGGIDIECAVGCVTGGICTSPDSKEWSGITEKKCNSTCSESCTDDTSWCSKTYDCVASEYYSMFRLCVNWVQSPNGTVLMLPYYHCYGVAVDHCYGCERDSVPESIDYVDSDSCN